MIMPFNYAHALLALEAAEQTSAAAGVIALHPQAYRAGAMGPDPYFADTMPSPLFVKNRADLAGHMHSADIRLLLDALFRCADTPLKRAYTLGFLCHFTLDTNAHAYIFARFPGSAHTPGEMHMDLPFAALIGKTALITAPPRFFRLTRRELAEIDALHADIDKTLFDTDSRGVFARSYKKWVYLVNRLSFDIKGGKRRFFGWLESLAERPGRITGWLVTRDPADEARDIMNLRHETWAAPWAPAEERTESFLDLYNAALRETPALLDAAALGFESGDGEAALTLAGGRCMNGGPVLCQ